jgi:hypothetical protein
MPHPDEARYRLHAATLKVLDIALPEGSPVEFHPIAPLPIQ